MLRHAYSIKSAVFDSKFVELAHKVVTYIGDLDGHLDLIAGAFKLLKDAIATRGHLGISGCYLSTTHACCANHIAFLLIHSQN